MFDFQSGHDCRITRIIASPLGDSGRNRLSSSVPRHFGSVVATSVHDFAHDLQSATGLVENVTTASGHVTGTGYRHADRGHIDSKVRFLGGRWVCCHLTFVHSIVPVGYVDNLKSPVIRISEAQRYPLV